MGAPEPSGGNPLKGDNLPLYGGAPSGGRSQGVESIPPPYPSSPLIRRHDMLVCILAPRELPFHLGHVNQDLCLLPSVLAYDTLIYSCLSVIVRPYTCPRPYPPPTRFHPAAQLCILISLVPLTHVFHFRLSPVYPVILSSILFVLFSNFPSLIPSHTHSPSCIVVALSN